MTTTPAVEIDVDVAAYVAINEKIEALLEEKARIVERLRTLGLGSHQTSSGIGVTVAAPSRSFNLNRAWAALTPEQQALCTSPDPKKVKAQLPGVLVEAFMEAGTGDNRVTIK